VREGRFLDPRADVVGAGQDAVVVRLRWRPAGGPEDAELFQVLRLRDGLVVDMQDHRDGPGALRDAGVGEEPQRPAM
jgi:hypothetical protein